MLGKEEEEKWKGINEYQNIQQQLSLGLVMLRVIMVLNETSNQNQPKKFH